MHGTLPDYLIEAYRFCRSQAEEGKFHGSTAVQRGLGWSRGKARRAISILTHQWNLIPERHGHICSPIPMEEWPDPPDYLLGDKEKTSGFPSRISPHDMGYPQAQATDAQQQIDSLQQEVDKLRAALEYQAHSDVTEVEGGTMSLHSSDYHYHNKSHLLKSMGSMEDKLVDAISRFKPRRFIGSVGGDVVQGRGIYRNQHLDNVLNKREQQIGAAAWRFYELDQKVAQVMSGGEREWVVIQGNHDYSDGDSTCMQFVWACKELGVPLSYVGQRYVINIADEGIYNILVKHGYGNSTYNPTPNKLVLETLRELIDLADQGYCKEQRIRRVWHGHTHWRSSGTEQAIGKPFDVAGGLHRNDRANIGMNQRPTGWWVYVSLHEQSDILTPMPIIPHETAFRQDMDNPELEEDNRQDAARCLKAFAETMREKGVVRDWRLEKPGQDG